jgi:hypothetical protein
MAMVPMVAVVAEFEPQIAEKAGAGGHRGAGQAAGHAPDPGVGGPVEALGGAGAIGELPHQHEQRNHRKAVGGKLLPDIGCREMGGGGHRKQVGVAQQTGGEHGERDGHAEQHQQRHQHQADHGHDQGIHLPPFQWRSAAIKAVTERRKSTSRASVSPAQPRPTT